MAKAKAKAEYITRTVTPFAPPDDEGWFEELEVIKPMIAKYRIVGRAGQRIQVKMSIADELVTNGFAKRI